MNNICLLGDVIVDVSLKNNNNELKMRLGGIIHSARALWALDNEYELAFISPSYLDERIKVFTPTLGNPKLIKFGKTLNSPNLILINEVKEIGDQGYELILRDDIKFEFDNNTENLLDNVLITWGQFDINDVLKKIDFTGKKISLEIGENTLDNLKGYKFENIYVSTSSKIFKIFIEKNEEFIFNNFVEEFRPFCNQIILKENRGGTRLYSFIEEKLYQVSSQTKSITHSVGVGDVFNTVFETQKFTDIQENLAYASFIAMEYASTTFPINFKEAVQLYNKIDISKLKNLQGTVLNWEKRKIINIYIAAPDFDFVNTSPIEHLHESLLYHNFTPRRPIKENGQMQDSDSEDRKKEIYLNDMKILDECTILVAVLLYNDPGTLVEIGIANERKIPILLYDPYNIAKNCMLTNSVNYISNSLEDILCEIFYYSSKL